MGKINLLSLIETEYGKVLEENIQQFVTGVPLITKGTKLKDFLYHGTDIHPSKFELNSDYDPETDEGNGAYMCDIPEGVIFLTSDIREANAYGRYVIPCEVKVKRVKVYKLDSDSPSLEFDDDFCGYGSHGMYSEFINGGYDMLEVRGINKSTYIIYPDLVIPRTDLALKYYDTKK